jgi:hypothetical protein
VVLRRRAGLRARQPAGAPAPDLPRGDDPLLFTGGGTTELLLDLLFDVSLADPAAAVEDVRALTGPLWRLAEAADLVDGYGRPPLVRFVWGKAWNFPGVVAAVAERLEHFGEQGAPRRSWLRMRLLRMEPAPGAADAPGTEPTPPGARAGPALEGLPAVADADQVLPGAPP